MATSPTNEVAVPDAEKCSLDGAEADAASRRGDRDNEDEENIGRLRVSSQQSSADVQQRLFAPSFSGSMSFQEFQAAFPTQAQGYRTAPAARSALYSAESVEVADSSSGALVAKAEYLDKPIQQHAEENLIHPFMEGDEGEMMHFEKELQQREISKLNVLSHLDYLGRLGEPGDPFHLIRVWKVRGKRAKVYDCECGSRKALHNITKIKTHVLSSHFKKHKRRRYTLPVMEGVSMIHHPSLMLPFPQLGNSHSGQIPHVFPSLPVNPPPSSESAANQESPSPESNEFQDSEASER